MRIPIAALAFTTIPLITMWYLNHRAGSTPIPTYGGQRFPCMPRTVNSFPGAMPARSQARWQAQCPETMAVLALAPTLAPQLMPQNSQNMVRAPPKLRTTTKLAQAIHETGEAAPVRNDDLLNDNAPNDNSPSDRRGSCSILRWKIAQQVCRSPQPKAPFKSGPPCDFRSATVDPRFLTLPLRAAGLCDHICHQLIAQAPEESRSALCWSARSYCSSRTVSETSLDGPNHRPL